jgi:hypothetical protein
MKPPTKRRQEEPSTPSKSRQVKKGKKDIEDEPDAEPSTSLALPLKGGKATENLFARTGIPNLVPFARLAKKISLEGVLFECAFAIRDDSDIWARLTQHIKSDPSIKNKNDHWIHAVYSIVANDAQLQHQICLFVSFFHPFRTTEIPRRGIR